MHFTVLVVGDDVQSILEPYDENLEVESFIDQTNADVDETFKNYRVERYAKKNAGETLNAFEEETLKMEEVNSDWWYEYTGQRLDEEGNAISSDNPDAKWDWYTIGGRWMGQLILKKGAKGELGRPGTFDNKPKHDADQARICDVDWKAMRKEAEEAAGKVWDSFFNPSKEQKENCYLKPEYVEEQKAKHLKLYGTKENYIRQRGVWTTYALVSPENGWVAPGDMGWFGSSDDTEDRDNYDKEFIKILKSYPPETLITCVDCHI